MAPPGRKVRPSKGQVAFAVSAGAVAAAGAAIVLSASDGGNPSPPAAPEIVAADRLSYEVAPFAQISSIGGQTVVITQGETHSVRSEGRPQALALLEVMVEDGRLEIRPRERFGRVRSSGATFYVTMPRLDGVSLAGTGDVRIDRVEGERFAGSIAGRGNLSIGALEVEEADFSIAGSGDVVAAGSARRSHISIAGSGDVNARGLTSESATISILGSGDAALTVNGEAQVNIMGRGDVDIAGNATCSVSRMGRGDVRCGGGAN